MQASSSQASATGTPVRLEIGSLLLGVDTCGPTGSVALGRLASDSVEILGQMELAGRSYSATLVAAIAELLGTHGISLKEIKAIVAVNGPGSFTGVRVGLSAVKGLAEPTGIPVAVVSRLAVLAQKAGVTSAALDAHRGEVFLLLRDGAGQGQEMLAARIDLEALVTVPQQVAVCDEAARLLMSDACPSAELVWVEAPSAADAMLASVESLLKGRFVDLALLDGHYLRRSDAEIFGEPGAQRPRTNQPAKRQVISIRRMVEADIDAVMAIARRLPQAPDWVRAAYVAAVEPLATPKRIAFVAVGGEGEELAGFAVARLTVPEAELETIAVSPDQQRKGIARELSSSLAHELKRNGAAELNLEVRAGNSSARALYSAIGFRESGTRKSYYADPVEDAVLMVLQLS